MCCSKKICKLLLFVFNIVFFVLGAAALALGIFLLVDSDLFLDLLGKVPNSSSFDAELMLSTTSFLKKGAYMLIVAGAVIFVIGFCGLCGGIRESVCLLIIYAVLVGIILGVQLAAGIMTYMFSQDVEDYLSSWVGTLVTDYYSGATMDNGTLALSADTTGVSDALDAAQIKLQCCGATNYSDFQSATNWNRTYTFLDSTDSSSVTVTDALVPITCCKMTDTGMYPGRLSSITFVDLETCLTTADTNATNTVACVDQVKNLLHKHSKAAAGIGIGVALLEIFGLLASAFLISMVKKERSGVTSI